MKTIAIVLSGGIGARMGTEIPKQYQVIAGKPVVVHTLEQMQYCEAVDGVLVTADLVWAEQIRQWKENFSLTKLLAIVPASVNRQLSIQNGLIEAERFMSRHGNSGVIIQDAVRPLTSAGLMIRLITELKDSPCVMPVLPMTDTTYTSRDGVWVDGLLDRSTLFCGQAPEAFWYWPYLKLYREASVETLCELSGSCQLPFSKGWKVKMIPGERENIKITYTKDLTTCERLLRERGNAI